jgi:hypothetical protein
VILEAARIEMRLQFFIPLLFAHCGLSESLSSFLCPPNENIVYEIYNVSRIILEGKKVNGDQENNNNNNATYDCNSSADAISNDQIDDSHFCFRGLFSITCQFHNFIFCKTFLILMKIPLHNPQFTRTVAVVVERIF